MEKLGFSLSLLFCRVIYYMRLKEKRTKETIRMDQREKKYNKQLNNKRIDFILITKTKKTKYKIVSIRIRGVFLFFA